MAARPTREITDWVQNRANALLEGGLEGVRRMPFAQARKAATTHEHDYLNAYVADLANVIDFDVIRGAGVRMGVDPLGGAGVHYWAPIAERYRLDLTVVSDAVDPQFAFMTRGLGRQDPHGSVLALRDAAADRAEGPLRRRVRLRHRSRPPRHRHAQQRAAWSPTTICRC